MKRRASHVLICSTKFTEVGRRAWECTWRQIDTIFAKIIWTHFCCNDLPHVKVEDVGRVPCLQFDMWIGDDLPADKGCDRIEEETELFDCE